MDQVKYALRYLELGCSVIPIAYRSKNPIISWKAYQKRLPTEDEIRLWFGDFFRDLTYKEISTWFDGRRTAPSLEKAKEILTKKHNIAMCTGKVSGRLVVDCDSPEAIEMYYQLGGDRTGPYCVSQRGNQFHCSWKQGADLPFDKWPSGYSGRENLPNIDLRGKGNTAMVPFSVHWSGHEYRWENTDRINDLPEIPVALLQGDPKKGRSQVGSDGHGEKKNWEEIYAGVGEGNRNKMLASLAGQWAKNLKIEAALEMAGTWNERNDPPMDQAEVERTVRSIYVKETEHKEAKKAASDYVDTSGEFFARTDQGNAERLVSKFGKNMRYSPERKFWFIWDEVRWTASKRMEVERWSVETVRQIPAEGIGQPDNIKEALNSWAKKSESHKSLKAMINLAQSVEPMPILMNQFDQDQFLLCATNGVIDLRNGEFRPHSREDYLTKMIPVAYDPKAECPQFKQFLGEIFNWNQAIIDYLQRVFGYCLTGSTAEQCMWMFFGDGGNGKSTLCNVVTWLMGEYAKTAPRNTFVAKTGGDRHPAELAHLAGARLVIAEEANRNSKFSEGLVKSATGSRVMPVRFMRENFWELKLTYKIIYQTNHLPLIQGSGNAMRRRIKPIVFSRQFENTCENRDLDERLFEAEASGILNWAVQGCLNWIKNGLQEPAEIELDVDDYMKTNKVHRLYVFMTDCCVLSGDEVCGSTVLFEAYTKWSQENRLPCLSQKSFVLKLEDLAQSRYGVQIRHGKNESNKARTLKGIALKTVES